MPTTIEARPRGDYRRLCDQVRRAGLLERRSGWYAALLPVTVLAVVAAWAALFVVGDSWPVLGVAVAVGVATTQAVFMGHDAGHQQVFSTRRANRLVGLLVGDVMSGMSFGWWVPKHNAHHVSPNVVGRDPDIRDGALVFTGTPGLRRQGPRRWIARRQAWLFFPFLLLEGVSLQVASVRDLLRRRDRAAVMEGAILVAHAAVYVAVIGWVLSPLRAVLFVAVQQAVMGLYLGATFAPNHKGMPILDPGDETDFARRQVVTARNVTGGPLVRLALGGLNLQIEHHLFPSMPRPNLVRAQGIVRAFCAEEGLAYCEDTLVGSYRQALGYLGRAGAAAAAAPPGRPGEVAATAQRPVVQPSLPAPGKIDGGMASAASLYTPSMSEPNAGL